MKKTIMKKRVLILAVAVALFVAAPASAALWWNPGDPGSTYQYWEFLSGDVSGNGGGVYEWGASPTEMDNPKFAMAWISGSYDAANGLFTPDPASGNIDVQLEIGNFPVNPYKEIWVDIGFTGDLTDSSVLGIGMDGPYTTIDLGPSDQFEFGFRIYPNPVTEDIFFGIVPPSTGGPAELDWIRVYTICIPEPATICLLGLGCLLLRRKRTL